MRSVLIVVSSLLAAITPAMAEAAVSISSQGESGWTSNATESPGGTADTYLRHSHDLSVTNVLGPLALRAGLMLEQQTFRVHGGEDDLSVTGGLEAGLVLAEGVSLRLGYAQTQSWTGEMAALGPVMLTITSPAIEHEMLGELTLKHADRLLTVGIDVRRRQPGLSEVVGLPLPPSRLEPETGLVTARMDGEWLIGPELAGLARLHWLVSQVPDADRVRYGREPASGARLDSGLRLRKDEFALEARGGVDLVWPQAAPELVRILPSVAASAEFAASAQLTLAGRALMGIDLFSPIDGVAGRIMEAELTARLALTEQVALSGGVISSHHKGLYDESLERFRNGVRSGLVVTLAPGVEAGLKASHEYVDEPSGAYPVSTIGMTLSGKV